MQAYRMYRPAYPMSRFLLLSILLSTLFGAPGMALELLLDDSDQLSITMPLPTVLTRQPDIQSADPQYWLAQDFSPLNYQSSIHASPYASWHKVDLLGNFNDPKPREKILLVNAHTLQNLDIYLFSGKKLIASKRLGVIDSPNNTSAYYQPFLGFHITDGQRFTLLIGKQSDGPGLLPLQVVSTQQYSQAKRSHNLFWGAMIAVIIAMALYNALVYAMHPNLAYLWYLAFHCSTFLYFSTLQGFGFWFWPSSVQVFLVQNILCLNFIIVLLMVNFSSVFLEAKRNAPKHYKWVPYLTVFSLAGCVSSFFVTEYHLMPIFAVLQLVASLYGVSMGYRALKNRFYPARFYLSSLAFIITGGAISTATLLNMLPASFFNLHSFLFGTVAELFILSAGLANRIKHTEQKMLSVSYMHPDTQAANFSYLKQLLPSLLPDMLANSNQLVIFLVNMKGYREVVSLYGSSVQSDIYQKITERNSNFLAAQNWAVALPLPMGKQVYSIVLPGAQMFILINIDEQHAKKKLKNISELVLAEAEKPLYINDICINLQFELGYTFINQARDFHECYRQAQTALLNAPLQHKKYLLYHPNQDAIISERLSLMHELKAAIEDETLQTYIQPQFTMKNQRLSGGEILIRWLHPQRGYISPGLFIPLAEKGGLIYLITQLVIKQTCQWLMKLKQKNEKWLDDFTLSINLSALDMAQADLLPFLQDCLSQYQVDANNIMLEITESAVMNNPDDFLKTIKQLKQAGFAISIDDFGTGYSSMMYLQTMQAQEIKIDLAFVRNIHRDKTKQNIVAAIIQLAHSTLAHTVAEGVECQEEADYLATLNCHIAQGYYWSPAISMQEFEEQYLRKT